jgi:hypothetical protein
MAKNKILVSNMVLIGGGRNEMYLGRDVLGILRDVLGILGIRDVLGKRDVLGILQIGIVLVQIGLY